MKKTVITICSIAALCYTAPACANVIWPALFIGEEILSSTSIIIASLIVEGILFYAMIKNISLFKAMLMSVAGNIASTLVGTIIMIIWMMGWHAIADPFVQGTFADFNIIATWILMPLASVAIEFTVLKSLFKYKTSELLPPILVGNVLTYALVAAYKFPNFPAVWRPRK